MKDWYEASAKEVDAVTEGMRAMRKVAKQRGNFGVAEKFDAAAYALDKLSHYKKYGKVQYDLRMLQVVGPNYEALKYSWPGLVRENAGEGFSGWLSDVWDWLTDGWHWDAGVTPSFPSWFRELRQNVHAWTAWWLMPWTRARTRFLWFFVARNGGKLLWDVPTEARLRTRTADTAYYEMRFFGNRYVLERSRLLEKGKEGEGGKSMFLTGICAAFSNNSDDEMDKFFEEKAVVASGWVWGWRSFVKQMDKVVVASPDLDWYTSYN